MPTAADCLILIADTNDIRQSSCAVVNDVEFGNRSTMSRDFFSPYENHSSLQPLQFDIMLK